MSHNAIKVYDDLDDKRVQEQSKLDEWILKLSMGAIGVAAAFFERLRFDTLMEKNLFVVALASWLLAIIFDLLSFRLSVKAHEARMDKILHSATQGFIGRDDSVSEIGGSAIVECWLRVCNWLVIPIFIIGCIALTWYLTLRIYYYDPHTITMSGQ